MTVFADPYGEAEGGTGRIQAVDMKGREVWRYTLPPDVNPVGTTLLDVESTEAGTLLFAVNGMGIYEVDLAGQVLWSLPDPGVTHDVDRLPNGNTLYTRGWAPRGDKQVVEVRPDGSEVWSWDGVEAFPDEPHLSLVDENGGWLHANGVQRLSDGTTLVCSRNFNTLLVLGNNGQVLESVSFTSEGSSTSVPATGRVPGDSPHDGQLIDGETRFLVALRDPPWVVALDRATGEPVWRWKAPPDVTDLHFIRTLADLPSGDLLVAAHYRILEVGPVGQWVWQYEVDPIPRAHTHEGEGMPEETALVPEDFDRPLYRAFRIDGDGVRWGG